MKQTRSSDSPQRIIQQYSAKLVFLLLYARESFSVSIGQKHQLRSVKPEAESNPFVGFIRKNNVRKNQNCCLPEVKNYSSGDAGVEPSLSITSYHFSAIPAEIKLFYLYLR
jgi:hypothetical protein